MVVQFVPSAEVWIWKAVAYAASQFKVTWLTDALAPRSTSSHCGSLKALDQRVPVLPSTALDAGNVAFSVDDAVAVLPCESSAGAALAVSAVAARKVAARLMASTVAARARRRARDTKACRNRPMAVLSLQRESEGVAERSPGTPCGC